MKKSLAALILLILPFSHTLQAQTEVMAWGNITGIRIEGHLMEFESYLAVAGNDLENPSFTSKERQRRPQYHRDGLTQQVITDFQGVRFEQTVTDTKLGTAEVTVCAFSDTTETDRNAFFALLLNNSTIRKTGKTIILENNKVKLTLTFSRKFQVREKDGICYIPLFSRLKKGTDATLDFTILAEGPIDNTPAVIQADFSRPGRRFDGFGGNFRLQNPQMDPKVIDYCLDNMRVAWGRVEMPWANWQPFED